MNHCKTIAIVNQKGGVGKTTSTINLGVGLAQAGNRVLLVDDDPQHSLTISLGIRNADDDLDTTLATAMQAEIRDESVPWEEGIIHSGEGVDLLPANIELSGVEMSLFNAMSREQVLKSVLSRVKENYDYTLTLKPMSKRGVLFGNEFRYLQPTFKTIFGNFNALQIILIRVGIASAEFERRADRL